MAFAASAATLAQTSQTTTSQNPAPSKDSRQPPAFSAAGVQGSTSPSGYSTGISREENSAVSQGVNALGHELLSGYVSNWLPQSCSLESELVKAAQANPQAYEANHRLGLFYLEHGEFSRSVPYLESARRLRPADHADLHALALALLGDKKNHEAIDLLQAALATSGQDAVLLRLLALAYQLVGNEGQAREIYQHAIAVSPDDASNLLAAGLGLIGIGAAQQATELFGSATANHPNDAKLWLGLGIGQDMMQRKPDAIRSLLRAIAIDRDLAPAYFFLAALADAYPESATEIRTRLAEFVVAHPSSADAHYDYALALWLQDRRGFVEASSAETESQLRLALAADPDMAKAHYLLGLLYSDAGDLPRAENELSEAVRLEPGNAEAHYRLAQDYKRDRRVQLAATEMRQFQSLRGSGNLEEPIAKPDLRDAGGDLIAQLSMAPPCNRQP
jgi:tetratricopeptide (TPR) repeat protein